MRYRKLNQLGDMTFGHGPQNFWVDQPEGVAQWIMTRLRLNYGEWFADTTDGTPWRTQVLGERTRASRDPIVRNRVQTTPNVLSIDAYQSNYTAGSREWTATMAVTTTYGKVVLSAAKLPGTQPDLATGIVIPVSRSTLLGITSGRTAVQNTPAALLGSGPHPNIADFAIINRDAGTH